MASFLIDLAKLYVEKCINGVIAESSYICCFTRIADDFEEERAWLEDATTTIKMRVDVATMRGENVQANALFWEEEAEKLIQEDTKTNQKCFFGFCPHCIWRYRRGKELTNKKEQIKRLIETGKQLSIGLTARPPDVECYSPGQYIPFKSRESEYNELLGALKDDNNLIIGLHGMGGTGKTTMAIEVGKELKQSKQFTQIIHTTVSFSPDIKKIQDDIARPLGLKFDDCNESDRHKILWSRLTNGEKILLILDDVWGDINFDEIGIPDSDYLKGCRILVPTRSLLVCNRLRCSKTIQLHLLSEEDAWIMFQRHAGLSKISSKFFLLKGRKIATECKRLPIAIAVTASSLKGEHHREEWDMALYSFQKHMPMHGVDDDLVRIFSCFKFSYDNMKDEKTKRLFLLCSVFREDEKIPTEMLTRLGIGGGLFGEDYFRYEDVRNQAVVCKNKLLVSCLLLEANQSRVKMHDLVRDAAQWIAIEEIQTVKLYDKNQKAMVERKMNIKYLLCEGKLKDLFSFKLDGSSLEILIATVHKDEGCHNVKIEVPNSFFENSTGLRVFHLIYDHYSNLSLSLPQSIQLLNNIRSLLFSRVDLGDISILVNLQSLETLDLDGCEIDELPHGITKLKKFRLLNLDYCKIARNNPFQVIEGCSSLEELYFRGSFNDFCREITFPELQRFYIDENSGSEDDLLLKCVSYVDNDEIFLSKTTLMYCMQESEVLRLGRIVGEWRNIIPEMVPLDQGMNDLVELHLRCISQLKCLIDTMHTGYQVSKVFCKLVVLKLEGMDNLEELFNGSLSFDSLNSLEKLSIKDCTNLKSLFKCNLNLFNLKSVLLKRCPMLISLFQLSTAVSLVLLERLEINDCGCLEYIIDERNEEELRGEIVDDNDIASHGSLFQKLEILRIKECPKIELILPLLSAGDLPALESITMKSCDKLKYIFDKNVELGSLKQLELDWIPNFIDIFPECNRTMTPSIKGTSSKPQAQSDPIKYNIFSWIDIYCCGKKNGHKSRSTEIPLVSEDKSPDNLMESNSYSLDYISIWERAQCLLRPSDILCNIKEITLGNILKMRSVFILSIAPRMLLETLTIRNCDELKHIIIDTGDHDNSGANNWGTVFPNLRKVEVEDCERLEDIIGHNTDGHQNHVEIHLHLPVLEGLYLENLPSLVAVCPEQYRTTFPPLKELVLNKCCQFAIKSIGDFMTHHSVTRSVDCTTIKELSGNMEHFVALERLKVGNSNVESICLLNEVSELQMNLGLQNIELDTLPMLTCLFVGLKNSFYLKNLTEMKIKGCEKLEFVFSTSIIMCQPQLLHIRIEECKELKHMIEDDLENKNSSNFMATKTCFPKLKTLVVAKCNKLKYVFPISLCKELPELYVLMIRDADELEEIFVSEDDHQKSEIPNLKFLVFENLPSFWDTQRIQYQAVKYRFIQNCQKLSLASSTTAGLKNEVHRLVFDYDYELYDDLTKLFKQLHGEAKGHDTSNEYPSSEITEAREASRHEPTSSQKEIGQTLVTEHGFVENVPRHEIPSIAIIPTNSEELMNEQPMEQQRPLGETDATVKPLQENTFVGSTSEKNVASTLSTISETTKNELAIQLAASKHKGIKISVEEGTSSANAKTITSPPHLKSVDGDVQIAIASPQIAITKPATIQDVDVKICQETSKANDDQVALNDDAVMKASTNIEQHLPKDDDIEDGDDQIAKTSFSIANTETNDQVSRNDDAFKKVRSNTEEQFPTDDDILVSKSRPSYIAPQYPSKPVEGDPSQIVEDFSWVVTREELENLVSKNHLAIENLSLLTEFLVKHPSVLLRDTSLSSRYKGYAYNCLAELLKFLQTHSVLDVLGSRNSTFVELIQDVRRFPFDKEWLDGVEKRALFPGLQVSQDALQKLLNSKYILTQHVEDLKHQLASSEAVLQSITQQEAQFLETRLL